MLSLFKLKKKSKKSKDSTQDDEKENTSSPTKVKKVEKSSKKDSKSSKNDFIENNANISSNLIIEAATNDNIAKVKKNSKKSKLEDSNNNSNNAVISNSSSNESQHHQTSSSLSNNNLNLTSHDNQELQVEIIDSSSLLNNTNGNQQNNNQSSPLSSKSGNTNMQTPRAPILFASDTQQTASFVRGNFCSSTISGSDLNRFLTSGYLNGDNYLQRGGVEVKTPKSPHFHRPANFSYSRNAPNYVTPYRSSNRVSASSSDTGRTSRTYMDMRGRSSSPNRYNQQRQQQQTVTTKQVENPDHSTTTNTTTTIHNIIPVQRNLENEEPIRLSKFSGGYCPDQNAPHKIEGLDWPAPPYPAAMPELQTRSRSSSNRRAPSTIHSVNGEEEISSDDDDDDQEVKRVLIDGVETFLSVNDAGRHKNGSVSVLSGVSSSAMARAKASRPNSKLKYQNKLFDNDYDDYLLRYKSDKEWRKLIQQHDPNHHDDNTDNEHETTMNEEDAGVGGCDSPPPAINAKLQREIEEISKIENESSMAAALLSDLRTHQKAIARKLKIDPWKASRTPSANIEPTIRTRFESPVNASPSRVLYNRSNGGLSSTISGHTLSVTPGYHTSHTYFGEHSSLASPRSAATLSSTSTILAPAQLNSSTIEGAGPHTGMKAATLPAQQQLNSMFYPSSNQSPTSSYLNRNNYINSSSRVISSSATQKAGNLY